MKSFVIFLLSLNFATPVMAMSDDTDCVVKIQNINKASERDVRLAAEKDSKLNINYTKIRGYSILIGTMVGSAAVATYLTSQLPSHFQFLSQLIGQISAIGIYVFGAPIWEPLNSSYRKFAFGVKRGERSEMNEVNQDLEFLWGQTQQNYSLNSQMSRNMLNQFIMSAKQSFYEAHRAMRDDNPEYAIDQIAETAVRMRKLFKDISPDDPMVALAVRTSFISHINQVGADRVELIGRRVIEKINFLDSQGYVEDVEIYYKALIATWFNTGVK